MLQKSLPQETEFRPTRLSPPDGNEAANNHFLAGKDIGFMFLFLTVFSTSVSGYSVVGIPGEASEDGFTALRWLAVYSVPACVYATVIPRIRRLSMARNYGSPLAFFRDRYASPPLHFGVMILMVLPNVIYITAQVISLDQTIETVTLGEINGQLASGILCVLLLTYEVTGGFNAVALADNVAGCVLVFGFLSFPILLGYWYGGFEGVVPAGCQNEVVNEDGSLGGCLAYENPQLLTHPSAATASRMLSYGLINHAYILNPQILQRLFAARSDRAVRNAQLTFTTVTFLVVVPGILIGVTRSSLPGLAGVGGRDDTFGLMTGDLIEKGGLSMVIAWVVMAGSLAAILSTTGAAVMGVSNVLSVDLYKHTYPEAPSEKVVRVGKLTSLCTYAVAYAWAQDDSDNVSELAALQVVALLAHCLCFVVVFDFSACTGVTSIACLRRDSVRCGSVFCESPSF
jgi:SSS family solute:Na+ symporter/sodium/pantothenate symporter